jgi:hypothetical protein
VGGAVGGTNRCAAPRQERYGGVALVFTVLSAFDVFSASAKSLKY